MAERTFLGWDRPLLGCLVDWLWTRRESLPVTCVVVPTAHSGRRLREALAERAAVEGGAILSPRVVTAGAFFAVPGAAPEAVEVLAWMEVLEGIEDWEPYAAAFPVPPGEGEGPGWAMGLARSLAGLRQSLQEFPHSLASASKRMEETVEADRWLALARMETLVDRVLASWGYAARVPLLLKGEGETLLGLSRVVLAGVPDLPPAVEKILQRSGLPVNVLIAAPASKTRLFDEIGRPLAEKPKKEKPEEPVANWAEECLPWPEEHGGSTLLVADTRQQAKEAVRLVAESQTPSTDIALGAADEETAGELVRAFGRAGWLLHDPSHVPPQAITSWLKAWRRFVNEPDLAAAIDLLGCKQTGALVGGMRAQRVHAISKARAEWLCQRGDDLARVAPLATREVESLQLAVATMRALEGWRGRFLREEFAGGLRVLLDVIDPGAEESGELREALALLEVVYPRVEREHGFWIDLLLASLPEARVTPPDDRVLDVLSWMELLFEGGAHLVVCGMNEGMVPVRLSADPWLPDSARRQLGLTSEAQRASRDAFVFTSLIESRRTQGRVDLLLGKTGGTGDALLPSRLLLAATKDALPDRVRQLFREIEPPDAALAWTSDWLWRPRIESPRPHLSVTTFADYLACPQRFYLKHVLKMQTPEPERVEWNARDFGTIAHLVVEEWGRDEEARSYSKVDVLEAWVHAALDRIVLAHFGARPPLAVRIQMESLRQRLSWFAEVQACEAASGWSVLDVEKKFSFALAGYEVRGTIDRIERHRDGRMRVLDYKTRGTLRKPEAAHRIELRASTRVPEHLQDVNAVLCQNSKGKTMLWRNLQLALYAKEFGGKIDELGYFGLGHTPADVKILLWEEFTQSDVAAAETCATWVLEQIQAGKFGPAADVVDYDDFSVLAMDRPLAETMTMEGGVR